MNYSILVLSPNVEKIESWFALQKHRATPYRVFFYKDGAYHIKHRLFWTKLKQYWPETELIFCTAALDRRSLSIENDDPLFSVGGLGLLAECLIESDEIIEIE